MKAKEHLRRHYFKNKIPFDKGLRNSTSKVPFSYFKLLIRFFSWRKSKLYIHDLEHIVNYKDTSLKGEIFVASWEIAVGYWRNFPLSIFPFLTMGLGLWKNPSAVYHGFYKGIKDRSIKELKLKKEQLLEMDLIELQIFVENTGQSYSFWQKFILFTFTVLVSQIIFLLPLIVLIIYGLSYFFKL